MEHLGTENETLRDQLRQTEKDTLDVISFLKKQDIDKDAEVNLFCKNFITTRNMFRLSD